MNYGKEEMLRQQELQKTDEPQQNKAQDQQMPQQKQQVFTDEDAKRVLGILQEYNTGKITVDRKATENQEWWRMRHWSVIQNETNEARKDGKDETKATSAWAINSILNKHADIMDSFPKPNILPREQIDENEATMLSAIVPAILDQNDYEDVYRSMGWDVSIDGAALTGVFWNSLKNDGMGDITVSNIDVHNLFWQPGIRHLQDSKYLFHVNLIDVDDAKAMYPDVADKIGGYDSGIIDKYIHDDNIDTSNCVECVDCYYKKMRLDSVQMDGQEIFQKPVTVLHLAKIVGGQLVFCSENEEGYENGFYEHGRYPFVIRRLFPIKDSPWGFGYLDIMKNPQMVIDKLDQSILRNVSMKSKPRYWVRKNAAISKDEFSNWDNELVEVGTGELDANIKRIECDTVPPAAFQHLANKIDELKETSGNRDFSQGSTQSGVTAASAIAALQEAGSKLSRDINKELYVGAREEYYLIIELIRQFYSEDRSFRIDDGFGGYQFQEYSNQNIIERDVIGPDGIPRHKKAVFDIKITAEKQSPFSRAAQNETAKELYGLGLFHPDNIIPALVCIDMMDFEGKDKVKKQLQDNATMLQQYQLMLQFIGDLCMADPNIMTMAQTLGIDLSQLGIDPMMAAQQQGAAPMMDLQGTPEDRAAGVKTDNSLATQARQRVAKASNPY